MRHIFLAVLLLACTQPDVPVAPNLTTQQSDEFVPPPPPVAHFTVDCKAERCWFDASTLEYATLWGWEFGDGTFVGNLRTPYVKHTYAAEGSYLARVMVMNAINDDWDTLTVVIHPKH